MLKVIGACIIVGVCAYTGFLAALGLKKRAALLAVLGQGFLALKREITYSAAPLQEALQTAANAAGEGGALFALAAQGLASGAGLSAQMAWQDALARFPLRERLKPADVEILAAFGEGLGLSDAQEQENRIELCRLRLASAEEAAVALANQMGKVWRNLGWALGLLLTLLFL